MKTRRRLLGLLFGLAAGVAAATAAGAAMPPLKADKVLVFKSRRRLFLLLDGVVVRSYRIALGRNPKGRKLREGDGRTPEGTYYLDERNEDSAYFRSIRISYPNLADIARASARGVEPGGAIMIHGLPNGYEHIGRRHLRRDWTEGCIAVTNEEILEIWAAVEDGTEIEIRP